MSFETIGRGGPEYLVSSLLAPASHCFSTRLGGVSTGSLASLNLGIHRGDRPGNVWENYRIRWPGWAGRTGGRASFIR